MCEILVGKIEFLMKNDDEIASFIVEGGIIMATFCAVLIAD